MNIAIYDDRVEIENPGRFPADVNPNELERSEEENKKNTSQPPNEIIANVLYLTGTTEHWGRGLALIYDECDRIGVERPRYLNDSHFVRIIFKRPDMSKWTHDGFANDTVATENDTVGVSKDKVGVSSERENSSEQSDYTQISCSPKIRELINIIGESWLSAFDLTDKLGLKSRNSFVRNRLNPALEQGYIELMYPESPKAPKQRYGLSDKGKAIYYAGLNSLKKE